MPLQTSMGKHKLDIRYGDRNSAPYYNGVLLPTLLSDEDIVAAITAGSVYSLTTAGYLVPGILETAGTGGGESPFYGISGLDENNYPDVKRDPGMPGFFGDKPNPAPGYGPGTSGFPFHGVPTVGNSAATPVGSFATITHRFAGELSTTEFDTSATYTVGQPLTCVSAAATGTQKRNRGKIRPLAASTDTIIGYVAPAGKFIGPEGYWTLAFYPAFVKGTTVPTSLT